MYQRAAGVYTSDGGACLRGVGVGGWVVAVGRWGVAAYSEIVLWGAGALYPESFSGYTPLSKPRVCGARTWFFEGTRILHAERASFDRKSFSEKAAKGRGWVSTCCSMRFTACCTLPRRSLSRRWWLMPRMTARECSTNATGSNAFPTHRPYIPIETLRRTIEQLD